MHHAYREIQNVNSGNDGASSISGSPGCDHNRDKKKDHGRSAENNAAQASKPRVVLENAGEDLVDYCKAQRNIYPQAHPVGKPEVITGNRLAVIHDEEGALLHN